MPPSAAFNRATKATFSRWAPVYDSWFFRRFYFERFYRKILEVFEDFDLPSRPKSFRILEVACGTGEVLHRLASRVPHLTYTGVDLTPAMLKIARQKLSSFPRAKFFEANAAHLPLPARTFDFVFCTEAFHHFDQPEEALHEIARVLKPGGTFLLADIAYDTLWHKIVVGFGGRLIEVVHHYYSKKELRALLEEAGFSVQRSFYASFNNFFVVVKSANKRSR